MSNMQAGKMDQRVTLQSRGGVADAMGQIAIVWSDVETVWAQVLPVRGAEFFAAAQMQAEQMVTVRIRHRADVLTTWRLVWRGLAHDIVGVITVGRNELLEIMCTQGVKDGV
jgi:SPP1 family predicted phage head-tail adaptor